MHKLWIVIPYKVEGRAQNWESHMGSREGSMRIFAASFSMPYIYFKDIFKVTCYF